MKKILFLIFPIVFLASCQQYDNSIHGTTITAGSFVPSYDSTGKATGTRQVQDTAYLVSPTWRQAWTWAAQRNNRVWFWVGLAIIAASIAVFMKTNNPGTAGPASVIYLAIGLLVGGALAGGSVDWEKWGMDQEIQKTKYDALMKDPGNLGPFWDTIRIK